MNKLFQLLKANAGKGKLRAEASDNSIYLYDVICGSDMEAEWFGGTSPKQFIDLLGSMNGDVSVHINSPGGDVFGGQAIAEAIRQHDGTVTAYVDGVAASVASVIAVACDKVVMAQGGMLMIHKAWTIALGNSDDFTATAKLLDKVDGLIAEAYAAKSGGKKDAAAFTKMMGEETWLTPDDALAMGLSDETAEPKKKGDAAKAMATWDLSAFAKAPQIIDDSGALGQIEAMIEKQFKAFMGKKDEPAPVVEATADEFEHRQRLHAVRMLEPAA